MSYTIEDIARIIGARRIGDRPAAIDWLLTDSRSWFAEETLFFALPTKRNDGTRYIRDLYARGVRNFVVSEERLNEVGSENRKLKTPHGRKLWILLRCSRLSTYWSFPTR